MTSLPPEGPSESVPAIVDATVVARAAEPPNVYRTYAAQPVNPVATAAVVTPTQVRHPWRSVVRTIFQMALALATLIPLVVTEVYTDADATPAVIAQVLAVAGIVTKVMALPGVEKFLQDFAPWLATSPPALTRTERKALQDDQ